jgi:hypothetical protein
MASWLSKRLSIGVHLPSSKKAIDHRAWFLCKLLASSIDESIYEQIRHRLLQSAGVETRVRLTADGWMSGSKKTNLRLPAEFYPIENVEALTVDTVYYQVLICVIHNFGGSSLRRSSVSASASPPPDNGTSSIDYPFQIIAYRFENDSLPRRYVECFESIRSRTMRAPPVEQNVAKKSRFSRKKKVKAVVSSGDVEADNRVKMGSADTVRHKSLIPGRLAAGTGSLAVDRWTVRDRSTPRLFASASLDNLLEADGDGEAGAKSRRKTTTPKKVQIGTIARSQSYDNGLDDTHPVDISLDVNNGTVDADEERERRRRRRSKRHRRRCCGSWDGFLAGTESRA